MTSQRLVVGFGLGSIGLALLLGYEISWSLIGPVKRMDAQLKQIALGDSSQRVEVPNRDEIGGSPCGCSLGRNASMDLLTESPESLKLPVDLAGSPENLSLLPCPSVLVAMASCTRAIPIGILVFGVLLRHPFILAGSVAVAQVVSGGRVRVGLGVGDRFSRFDHQTLGIPFPPFAERVHVLEACCRALPALWQGQHVTEPLLRLKNATLGPVKIAPAAVILGGGNRAIIETTVRHAQGWNLFMHDPATTQADARLSPMWKPPRAGRRLARSVYLIIDRLPRDLSLRRLLGTADRPAPWL